MTVDIVNVSGEENRSDTLTKNLAYEKFAKFSRVMMHELTT